MDLRTDGHRVFLMHAHVVFVKKYRRKVFTKQIIEDLREIFDGACQSFEAELSECEGEGDHVHLLVNYLVSKLVNSLKTASSRVIRKKVYPTVEKAPWGGALWSPSSFAGSSGGASIDFLKQYIQEQDSPT